LLTNEKKMKKSSQPRPLFTTCERAYSLRKTVAMAMPVNTHPMALISVPLLSVKSTPVEAVAMAEE
jgi:hypothetical protein